MRTTALCSRHARGTRSSSTSTPRFSKEPSESSCGRSTTVPRVGLAGVLQVSPGGAVAPTMRRFPNATAFPRRGPRFRAFPVQGAVARRAGARSRRAPRGACLRLDLGLVSRRPPRGPPERGLHGRAVLPLQRRAGSRAAVKKAGWEVRHLPVMTVLHHGGQDRTDPRLTGSGRLLQDPVRGQAFLPATSGRLPWRARARQCAARGCARFRAASAAAGSRGPPCASS